MYDSDQVLASDHDNHHQAYITFTSASKSWQSGT